MFSVAKRELKYATSSCEKVCTMAVNAFGSSEYMWNRHSVMRFLIDAGRISPFTNERTKQWISYPSALAPPPTGLMNCMHIFPLFSYMSTSVLYTDSASLMSQVGGRLSSTCTNKSCLGESITFFRIRFSAPVATSTASPL